MDSLRIQQAITNQKQALQSFGLKRIGIFGSSARNQATSASDIDLLLDFHPQRKTYRNFIQSTELLEHVLKRTIDAVTPQALSPYIKPYIDQDITYVQISD